MHKIRLIIKALALSLRMKSRLSILVLICSFFTAVLPVLLSTRLQALTNELLRLGESGEGVNTCFLLMLQLAVIVLIQIIYQALRGYTQEEDRILGAAYISEQTIKRKCDIEYVYIENKDKFRERIERVEQFAQQGFVESVTTVVSVLPMIVGVISMIYTLGKWNGFVIVIILLSAIASSIITLKQNNENFFWTLQWSEKRSLSQYYCGICMGEEFIHDLRHYHLYPFLREKWESLSNEHRRSKNKMLLKNFRDNSASDVIRSAAYLLALAVSVYGIYQDPLIGIGTFALVFSLISQLQNTTSSITTGIALFLKYFPYMEEYFYIMDLPSEKEEKDDSRLLDGSITFSNVSYTYPESEHEVLHDISVSIKDGEKIAVVGENGSGKSTFISLLCGMLRAQQGSITVGGLDIDQDTGKIRNSMSIVFQNFARYADTLGNNIRVSDFGKEASDSQLAELMRTIHMEDILENGLDMELGRFSETGRDLSDGQWQKIAILRAAYRDKGTIMILDEPSSALDPASEVQLYRDFSKLTSNKTAIFISHRLGIVHLADRILFFKDGRIVEDGSHEQLLKKGGFYKEMYEAQAELYQ